jgi:protein MpaA
MVPRGVLVEDDAPPRSHAQTISLPAPCRPALSFSSVPLSVPTARWTLGVLLVASAVTLNSTESGAAARTSQPRRIVLGRSVEGRPIVAVELGDPRSPRKEVVVGCTHGNEPAGIPIARRLEHSRPGNVDLWIIPVLNPDGVAADTRGNAHGVDLNRNFPWRWRRLTRAEYSGPRPLSEPESRIARRLITRLRPQVTIWFHQHMDLVDESGGSVAVERRFATVAGLPLARLPREPGSAVGWENHEFPGTTAFVVELPAGRLGATATNRFARAALEISHVAQHEGRSRVG